MEESKKKATSTKKSTSSTKGENKTTAQKKVATKKSVSKTDSETKMKATRKSSSTKADSKKAVSKKATSTTTKKSTKKDDKAVEKKSTPKVEKAVEEKIIKEPEKVEKNKEEKELEKTIIFDGRQNKNIADVVNKLEEENVVLEDKILKRSKGKKIAIIIISLIIVAIILVTSLYVIDVLNTTRDNSKTLDSDIYKKVSEKYKTQTDISSNKNNENNEQEEKIYSNIETLSLAQFEEKALSKEDITIMVASETCYASMAFEPIVNEVFKEANRTIYKINISKLSSEEIDVFRTYYAFKSTPTIFTIKAGIVTADSVGNISKDDFSEWVKENVQ